jgi:hypothetical protein
MDNEVCTTVECKSSPGSSEAELLQCFYLSGFVYIILVASPMNGSNFTGLSGFCLDFARFRIKIMSKYLILNNIAQLYNVKAEYNQNIRGNNIPL